MLRSDRARAVCRPVGYGERLYGLRPLPVYPRPMDGGGRCRSGAFPETPRPSPAHGRASGGEAGARPRGGAGRLTFAARLAADDSAVGRDILAIDPARGLADQERDDLGDLFGLSQPAERGHIGHLVARLGIEIIQQHRSLGKSRRHYVDGDRARRDLERQRAAELLDCRLAAEVAGAAGKVKDGADGRDAYDSAAVAHVAQRFLQAEERALGIERVGPIEILFGDFRERPEARVTRIGDQDVESPTIGYGLAEEARDVLEARDIGLNRERPAPLLFDFPHRRLRLVFADGVINHYRSVVARKPSGHGAADTARSAGYQRDLVREHAHARASGVCRSRTLRSELIHCGIAFSSNAVQLSRSLSGHSTLTDHSTKARSPSTIGVTRAVPR